MCALNSGLFYWYTIKYSNGREFTKEAIFDFPFEFSSLSNKTHEKLVTLSDQLMSDLKHNSRMKKTYYTAVGEVVYQEFFFGPSKPIIDEIDRGLAQHYGLTDEELDFIINYDIKYRMGRDNKSDASEDEEE